MQNKSLNNRVLCLVLGPFLLVMAACDHKLPMEPGLHIFSLLNPDGDILAVQVGLKLKNQDRPAYTEMRPVLLKLDEDSHLKSHHQLKDFVINDLAWRPGHGDQLYYATFEEVYSKDGHLIGSFGRRFKYANGKLVVVYASLNENPATTITQEGDLKILSGIRWSPDGKILAGLVSDSAGERLGSGELGFSFDGGVTCESSGIKMNWLFGWQWLNNNELFIRTDQDSFAIISSDGQKFQITETIKKDFNFSLSGFFQEKPVYTAYSRKDSKGNYLDERVRLFVGDQLIYETDNPYYHTIVFEDGIIFRADDKVMVFDEHLSICHEMPLEEKTHLLNFHAKTNIVFLMKGFRTILCYDYTKEERPRVLFSVDMLDESSN